MGHTPDGLQHDLLPTAPIHWEPVPFEQVYVLSEDVVSGCRSTMDA